MLELLENHSVPERTIDLKAHGQLEDIDSPNLNHFTRRGLRSPGGSLIIGMAVAISAIPPAPSLCYPVGLYEALLLNKVASKVTSCGSRRVLTYRTF